jgi:hypothetical protein
MSTLLIAKADSYKMHNEHKRPTSLASTGFETVIPTIKRLQNYVLDRTAIGTG